MTKTYEDEVLGLLTDNSVLHLVAGLAAECGEVCGCFQKSTYKMIPIDRNNLKSELGDVLFYLTALALKCGWDLEILKKSNLEKLYDRHR